MKRKINQVSKFRYISEPENDIYRRYRYAFDNLLNLNDDNDVYLPDFKSEEKLDVSVSNNSDNLTFVIGYAGIGKSTLLQKFFGFSNSTPLVNEKYKMLVFPNNFNGKITNDDKKEFTDELARNIEATCSVLEDRYEELATWFTSREGIYFFYQYIKETNSKILEHVAYDELLKCKNEDEKIILRLTKAQQHDRLIFASTKLKCYLGKKCCTCEKIAIIVDDIEPLSYNMQKYLVMEYLRLFKCLKNISKGLIEKKFFVKVYIGLRPHTYRHMKLETDFIAYFVNEEIYKTKMIDLSDYLDEKIEKYKDKIPHEKKNAWDTARNNLKLICTKFDKYYQEQIKYLALWNTRTAIYLLKQIMQNRVWVQKNMERKDFFLVDERDYIFNNITVTRAIGCENTYLFHTKEGEENTIPNILYNSVNSENDYWFHMLLIIALFLQDSADDFEYDNAYGPKAIQKSSIENMFQLVFPNDKFLETKIENAIRYLYTNKVLRKGIKDKPSDKKDELSDETMLYLSPKGYELRKMISSDSVYFEMCREDIYRDYYGDQRDGVRFKSSFELFQEGEQVLIFQDLTELLENIIDEEKKMIEDARKNRTIHLYQQYFTGKSIAGWFYEGVIKSVKFSGKINFDNLQTKFNNLHKRINKNEALLNE